MADYGTKAERLILGSVLSRCVGTFIHLLHAPRLRFRVAAFMLARLLVPRVCAWQLLLW